MTDLRELLNRAAYELGSVTCHSSSGVSCDVNEMIRCGVCSPPGQVHWCKMVADAHSLAGEIDAALKAEP